ncbi:MAG TPA: NADH-quinone oxidoreductase subunit NuoE [Candidatus Krumholzibacteria bacterium]|nr:NADH-quinone oxidoreductase subunit NuoE [Candidatus Krumholzibacteria bacterium]HPD73370.1 NADH-quinone oxidoreductase subunit NuoE [Candidatus Krumholzibacteria bacterium]HRY42109.1 NADH-quinone oxidoreductase subunit NuoE [Candidatus Krumholzibacteria bacterium]
MSATTNELVDQILADYRGASRDQLIPVLQKVQTAEGYLSQESLARIGREMNLPVSKVYGVATFYNQFRFAPQGKYHFMLCRGTACHVKGSKKLLESVIRTLGIEPGQTSRDRLFSLEIVACMGACGLAPALAVNGEVFAKVTPLKLNKIIEDCRAKETAHVNA